jgi:tetratricopeptide (TPR) repeat protein
MIRQHLRSIGLLTTGLILGALLTVTGLSMAGKLKPPSEPAALVALAQSVEASDKVVDIQIDRGDIAGAIATLEKLRAQPWPNRERGGDAGIQIRHDAYGRLLRLRLDNPQVDGKAPSELLEIADEGLGREWELLDPNPFTARLLAQRGEILELLGRDDDALLDYERALDMNRDLLEEVLSGGGK